MHLFSFSDISQPSIVVHFLSGDQSVQFSWVCKITDRFADIEEKLYLSFPKLKNLNLFFLSNGSLIDRSNTLEQNKIKDDDIILIYIYEFIESNTNI